MLFSVFFSPSKTRLVRELEKKFSGKHVVIVAQVCNFLFLEAQLILA